MSALVFTYDIVCPFAYVASTRVRALAREAGVEVEYRPVLLGGIFRGTGSVADPNQAMPAAKARLTRLDALRQADLAGIELRFPEVHPQRTVAAMRLALACDPARRPELTDALFRAYWALGWDVADPAVLQQLAEPFGLDARAVNADPAVKQALFDASARAVADGIFGVPSFQVGDGLWWGADRLDFVREALGLPPEAEPAVAGAGQTVAFFHDFASPFSYLANARIGELERTGARIERVPFLLGALFQQIGTPMVPLHGFVRARREQQLADMQQWARRAGVPLEWPSAFPIRTVTALRAAIVEPGATDALYRAAWAQDRDLSDAEVVRGVLDEAGFDGRQILEQTREPATKARLFGNTERAQRSGVCGAPSFLVNDRHLFWGQDRLGMVARALSGWEPPEVVA